MTQSSLKEQAYQMLKQSILDGTYPDGALLTERTLSETLEMSRTPIRAAVDRLEQEGYLQCAPNRGIRVQEITLRQAKDFFDFRIALECHAVRQLAGMTLSPDALETMTANLDAQVDCVRRNDMVTFTRYDSAFHRLLVGMYGNQEMIRTMERLQDMLFRSALTVLRRDPGRIQASAEDHAAIWNAVIRQDADKAASLVREHLDYGMSILIR